MAPLDLSLAGFGRWVYDVDCVYKYYNFVVMWLESHKFTFLPDRRFGHHEPHHRKRNDHIQINALRSLLTKKISILVWSFELTQ